jgi:hypothetical protein
MPSRTHPAPHPRYRAPCPAAIRRPAGHALSTLRSHEAVGQVPSSPDVASLTVLPAPTEVPSRPAGTHVRHQAHRGRLGVAIVVAVVTGLISVAVSGTVRHQLLLSFTRQPDNFAELYFPSPGNVPTSFVAGRPLAVTFGLTNDSDVSHRYVYTVTAEAIHSHSTREAERTLRVGAGRAVIVPLYVSLPSGTTSLSISLQGQRVLVRLLLHEDVAHGG